MGKEEKGGEKENYVGYYDERETEICKAEEDTYEGKGDLGSNGELKEYALDVRKMHKWREMIQGLRKNEERQGRRHVKEEKRFRRLWRIKPIRQ